MSQGSEGDGDLSTGTDFEFSDDEFDAFNDPRADPDFKAYDPDKAAAEEMVKRFAANGSREASLRLAQDLQTISKNPAEFGFEAEPMGDNLYMWNVVLTGFEGGLAADLRKWAASTGRREGVHLRMLFPMDYPMAPPFVRVLYPRFQFMTGHITSGGSVCMQLLTRKGWTPANTIESILIQIRSEIMSDPKTRLDVMGKEYSAEDARRAFDRMCAKYGW